MATELPGLVGLDTNCFIYLLEPTGPRAGYLARELFEAARDGRRRAVTSILTMAELLVPWLRRGDARGARETEDSVGTFPGLRILGVNHEIALAAARIRAVTNLALIDCVQLARAQAGGADAFLTNDRRMRRDGTGIDVLILDELVAEAAAP